jgi:predicted amidohydrolase YtcJ
VPFSSDCPIVPGAPLDGIRAAVRRTAPSGRLLGPAERITVDEGIRNYTYWAAYATFDEAETGAIEPGKRADLCILSTDPAVELDGCDTVATMIGGTFVYGEANIL